ncbi:MAG: hypothetical protein ACOCUH_02675 [Bacteriovoracia bacterium]
MFDWDFIPAAAHYLIIKNETSQTSVTDYSKVKLLEILPKACTLALPNNSCSLGHMLTVYISSNEAYLKSIKFIPAHGGLLYAYSITGRVVQLFAIDDDTSAISLEFTQFKATEWKEIERHYVDRQNFMNDFLKKLKGKKEQS